MTAARTTVALALLATLALALVACGGGGSDADPEAVIEGATFAGIESADVDLALNVDSSDGGRDLDLSVSGPFETGGEGGNPKLALAVSAKGSDGDDGLDFEGGLTLLPERAYVAYEGIDYEVDPTSYSFAESALKQSAGGGGESACQEAAGELDFTALVKSPVNEGAADVAGTETTKISGELDLEKAIHSLREISESPACAGQLSAAGQVPGIAELEDAENEIESSVKSARVDLYVGDDDIVRRLVADLSLTPKGDDGKRRPVEVDLDLTLAGVNESQEIKAPAESKPLSELFLKLGVNPLELAGALQGGEGLGALLEQLGPASGKGGEGAASAWRDCIGSADADLAKCAELLR